MAMASNPSATIRFLRVLTRYFAPVFVTATCLSLLLPSIVRADPRSFYSAEQDYWAAVVVEVDTGKMLFARNPGLERAPASLVKMMTTLLVLEAVSDGTHQWDEIVTVSRLATRVGGSRLGLRTGERQTLREVTQAMFMASANDAALVLAEHLEASVEGFLSRMNERAGELGMVQTTYRSPHGLDGWETSSITTARDQSVLACELQRYPLARRWAAARSAELDSGRQIRNTNQLLGRFAGLDGLKTGYTGKAGYCLAATAERHGLRVACIVLGASSNQRRFSETAGILTQVYSQYQKVTVLEEGQDLGKPLQVPGGRPSVLRLIAGAEAGVVLKNGSERRITLEVRAPRQVDPPVAKGQELGQVQVFVGDSLAAVVPAVASRHTRPASFLERFAYRLGLLR